MTAAKTSGRTTARKPDIERFLQQILDGRHDERLADIVEAAALRATTGAVKLGWRITFDGLDVAEDDLTLDEACRIQEASGVNWQDLSPMKSALHARAVIGVLLETRQAMSEGDIAARFRAVKLPELLDCIRTEAVSPAPLS